MTVNFGFYNSVNGDRTYDAAKMSAIFDGLIYDGVFQLVGNAFAPTAAGGSMNITIGTGRAWFNSTWTHNDAPLVLTVLQAETTLNRIDTAVIEINAGLEVRANSIKIIKGTPAGSPVAPTLTHTDLIHQYPLCNIFVGAGVTEIVQANITSLIGSASCPFVRSIVQLLDYTSQIPYGGDTTNSGSNFAVSSPSVPALVVGMAICVKFNADSSGAATLNWNSMGAKPIKQASGSNPTIKNGGIYTLRYDGTNFILQGEGASGTAIASDLLLGKTASTDAGTIIGTMVDRGTINYTPGTTNQTVLGGRHSGTGVVYGSANLVAGNIRDQVNIHGVVGNVIPSYAASGSVNVAQYSTSFSVTGLGFTPKTGFLYYSQANGFGAFDTAVYTRLVGSGNVYDVYAYNGGFQIGHMNAEPFMSAFTLYWYARG